MGAKLVAGKGVTIANSDLEGSGGERGKLEIFGHARLYKVMGIATVDEDDDMGVVDGAKEVEGVGSGCAGEGIEANLGKGGVR